MLNQKDIELTLDARNQFTPPAFLRLDVNMDNNGQRENGRHKQDHYKMLQSQWMIPPHLMKDPHALTMRFMSILADRDTAIQERNIFLSQKKALMAELDMAILQRDAAISERNNVLMERDNALAALEYRENSTVSGSSAPTFPPGCPVPRGTKHTHHSPLMAEAHYNSREMHPNDAIPISAVSSESPKPRRGKGKRTKEVKAISSNKKTLKPSKKVGKRGGEDLNKCVTIAKTYDENEGGGSGAEEETKPECKGHNLSLNQVNFNDSKVPPPVCSCTGAFQQCYKWGKGGWQSACCTNTLSMYPLPVMDNKRYARLSGRKMSAGAFNKLLNRLVAEGHDLSRPLDLKDHWSRHGTNRYISIK